jgi:hypothetical protein
MKKLLFISALVLIGFSAKSQTTATGGETVLIYSLPKTVFNIDIETEKTIQKPGAYFRYSERYLATNKVVTEEKTSFKLKSINVTTTAVADPSRTYSFVPIPLLQNSHLSVNSQGILCGVNTVPDRVISLFQNQNPGYLFRETPKQDALLPLGEEYMLAGSEAKLAEGVAKQIYRIRESRLSLLTADVEKLPADGESLKTMLDGLNKLEKELTELFIGKTTTETQRQTITLTPSIGNNNQVLFRLSTFKGIVGADDLSGSPYYINIVPAKTEALQIDPKAKSEKAALYYVIPTSAHISIGDGTNTLYANDFIIPQFGKTLSLPESLFKQHVKIRIDPQTGRLLSIE